ncbi:MAG: tetratricopeptide repeat protein, partial [Acidobacteria bacterium]|nr:tetratricopeptide repeat protein [Acidobacteriota bacterium]
WPAAHWYLGDAYYFTRQYEQAADSYEIAVRLQPNNAEIRYMRGRTFLQLGNREGALAEYRVLRTLDADKANKLYAMINNQQEEENHPVRRNAHKR